MEPNPANRDMSDELTDEQQESVAGGGGLEGLSVGALGGNGGNGGAGNARPRAN